MAHDVSRSDRVIDTTGGSILYYNGMRYDANTHVGQWLVPENRQSVNAVGLPKVTVPVLFVSHCPSMTVRILHCIRKCPANKQHESNQEEETGEKYSLDMVHHVIFKHDEAIIYGLFHALAMRQRSDEDADRLTLTVLSKKFSECLALALPFAMLSRVNTMLRCVSWIFDPCGSTS